MLALRPLSSSVSSRVTHRLLVSGKGLGGPNVGLSAHSKQNRGEAAIEGPGNRGRQEEVRG